MYRLRSFATTLFCLVACARAIPLPDGEDDDDDGDDCWEPTTTVDSPSAAVLAPYEHSLTPVASPSQRPHATLPASHLPKTPVVLGTVFGVVIALVVVSVAMRYLIRCRSPNGDPPRPIFAAFWFRSPRPVMDKKRLSDESWVSPALPPLESPGSPFSLSHDLDLPQSPRRKLIPVTTPVCTPTDTEFGSRIEFAGRDIGPPVTVPLMRVPSPVYIPPLSSSPTPSESSASLSPTPSTEPLATPLPRPARLSRLLSSTFGNSRVADLPAQPMTAHFQDRTTRSWVSSVRFTGTRSRTSFYPSSTVRDTFSTVTTADTDTDPQLLHTVAEGAPLADARNPVVQSASASLGTWLGFRVRLSDASEHARYRLRELERQRERGLTNQRLSTTSMETTWKESRLRDSETGW